MRLTQFAVDRSVIGALLVNVKGQFKFVNEAAAKILGYSQDEILSMSVFDFNAEETSDGKWPEIWNRLRSDTKSEKFESTIIQKNGENLEVMITANYFEYSGTEYLWAFVRDITKDKEIAAQLVSAKDSAEAANRSQSRRSQLHDRRNDESHASHDVDGAVWDRGASDGTLTTEGGRHRQ